MDRLLRISQFWSWLPAFRAVAEYGSLPRASRAVALSASALSRSIRLAEEASGLQLFVRHAGGLTLTPAGEALLAKVRDAMRSLDGWLSTFGPGAGISHQLRLGFTSPLGATLIARALDSRSSFAQLQHLSEKDGETALLTGAIDLLLTSAEPGSAELQCTAVGRSEQGVYAAHQHPLACVGAGMRSLTELVEHSFAALEAPDGWPPAARRQIIARCNSLEMLLSLTLESGLLSILPSTWAEHVAGPELRLLYRVPSPIHLHAWRRKPLLERPRAEPDPLVELLKAAWETLATEVNSRATNPPPLEG